MSPRIRTRDPKPVNRDPVRDNAPEHTALTKCECGASNFRRRGTVIDPANLNAIDYLDCSHCKRIHKRIRTMTSAESAQHRNITGGVR